MPVIVARRVHDFCMNTDSKNSSTQTLQNKNKRQKDKKKGKAMC